MHALNAADWKESLDFKFQGIDFNYIKEFHQGLSDAEEEYSSTKAPPKNITIPFKGLKITYDIKGYDNIGNAILTQHRPERELSFEETLELTKIVRAPMNTTNTALGALQVIITNSSKVEAHFLPLIDRLEYKRGNVKFTRFFDSNADESPLYALAAGRLAERLDCPETVKSKPSLLDQSILEKQINYHPHSEEKMIACLSIEYEHIIRTVWDRKTIPDGKINAVILHLHTRRDMCGDCAYIIDWELNHPKGFGSKISAFCKSGALGDPVIAAFVSSRQNHNVWGQDRRILRNGPPADKDQSFAAFKYYTDPIDLTGSANYFAQHVISPFVNPTVKESLYYRIANNWGATGWASKKMPVVGLGSSYLATDLDLGLEGKRRSYLTAAVGSGATSRKEGHPEEVTTARATSSAVGGVGDLRMLTAVQLMQSESRNIVFRKEGSTLVKE